MAPLLQWVVADRVGRLHVGGWTYTRRSIATGHGGHGWLVVGAQVALVDVVANHMTQTSWPSRHPQLVAQIRLILRPAIKQHKLSPLVLFEGLQVAFGVSTRSEHVRVNLGKTSLEPPPTD